MALTRFKDERLIAGQHDGDMTRGILPAGQVAGAIDDLIDVATFIPMLVRDAIRAHERIGSLLNRSPAAGAAQQ